MLTNKELQNFYSLLSNTEIANIEIALGIAAAHNISINLAEINEIYQFAFGVKAELLDRSPLSKKLRALNLYPKLILNIEEGTINQKSLIYLRNLKVAIVKTKTSAPQFLIQYIKKIFDLKSIEKLSLINYQLPYLPKNIENLKNLEVLSLNRAMLKEFPENIGHLQKLKKIELINSSLKVLPKSISLLKNLEELNIKGTEIRVDKISIPSKCKVTQ